MKTCLKSIDCWVWNMVKKDYELPSMVVEGVKLSKPEDKWEEVDMKQDTLSAKSMNPLVCALSSRSLIMKLPMKFVILFK